MYYMKAFIIKHEYCETCGSRHANTKTQAGSSNAPYCRSCSTAPLPWHKSCPGTESRAGITVKIMHRPQKISTSRLQSNSGLKKKKQLPFMDGRPMPWGCSSSTCATVLSGSICRYLETGTVLFFFIIVGSRKHTQPFQFAGDVNLIALG